MDRQKHRLSVLIAVVLLAGGMAFALGRQWVSTPDSAREPGPESSQASAGPPLPHVGPMPVEAGSSGAGTAASAPTSAAAGPAAFRGRVVDAVSQQPVQEFEVHLIRVRPDTGTLAVPIGKAFRSASGRFTWNALAEGRWRAAINAPGYQQFNLDELNLSRSGMREIAMPLRRGYELHGRVVELNGGVAVVGAYVSFRPFGTEDDFSRYIPYAQSQEDGSFSLDGIPGGDIVLSVIERQHAPRHVTITVNEKTPPQEIALATGGTISGTLVTAAGAPVKTWVMVQGPGDFNSSLNTSETGQFVFEHLAASRYRLVADTKAGRVSHDMTLGEEESANVVLVLDAGRRIGGTIKGFRPELRGRIQVVARHEYKPGLFRATIEQQGTYALNGVPPGNVVVSVFGPSLQFNQRVVVPSEADVTLDIEYPSGARLSGIVTQGGKLLREKVVRLQRVGDESEVLYHGTTSEQGRYEIEGLPPGEYFLRAEGDTVRRIAVAGDGVQNIEMTSLQLSARVVEDGGAVPIVGARVFARGTGLETAGVRSNTETDDFGRFALTGIEPGEIMLIVYKPGYELYREKILYSAPTNQAITLRRSAGVEVRVKQGSRRFPRGFTITQSLPGSIYVVDLWMPVNREGTYYVPSALAGTTFQIGRFGGEPIVIEKWDGQPFELQ